MENLRLHSRNAPRSGAQADWPLQSGVLLRLARDEAGRLVVGSGDMHALPLAHFRVDRRGLWLLLADDARGVHVNGRPVRRMAMLRAGDSIHAEGMELLVQADVDKASSSMKNVKAAAADDVDVRAVLRGAGGRLHGRSFPLSGVLAIGSGEDCQIRIDGLAAHHADLHHAEAQVTLRVLDAKSGCMVNGIECRDAVRLQAGDQVAFGAQRFVLEIPQASSPETARSHLTGVEASATPAGRVRHGTRRWPWLLLAALLLGLALGALLLFGGR